MSFLGNLTGGLLGGSTGADDAAQAKIAGLNAGYSQASDLFGTGRGALNTNYASALKPFQTTFDSATLGANAYGNALGLNGPGGSADATAAFRNNPGYGFAFDQGLQGIDRGAAARGMLTSGNTLNAEQQFGTGLADQTYQSYVKNLQPYLGQQLGAAGGIAGVNMGLGNSLNTSYGNQGNLAYNTQAGIGNANASADLANANSSNAFLGNILNLGTKLLGFV